MHKRQFRELHIMLTLLGSLWDYGLKEWCRLTIPNLNDSRRSCWPTRSLWAALSDINWGELEIIPLMKLRKDRSPSDETLFVNDLGVIISFMTGEGIEGWSERFGEYIAKAKEFHDEKAEKKATSI